MGQEGTVIHQDLAPHSVTLTTNAKGKVQAEVKVYSDNPTTAAEAAINVLAQIKARLAGQMAE